ncbi:YihY/virulence factor BrkB family protein [Cellulomonas sp. ATA003]|uniref:YihY/virulence factor BrkB family protein n=1 Tax=Cellulomonas sp. ATA003 TaxID=3073064 RepID=UPI002872D336|nr:YihY/virulence factor BrkB family protein [Cellulomonas sp. ATA003]WNB86929.1 YihY/virulence factor BrkB family protein [Cellulomonas sp. ATA003]
MDTALPSRVRARLGTALGFGREYVAEVIRDRVPGLAAETAFFVVLGIFPGLLIAASLLGLLDVLIGADLAEQAQRRILEALDLVLTDEASGALRSVESLFQQTRGGVLTVATASALVTVSGAFAVVINALNIANDSTERRTWIRRRLLGLLMGLVTMVVVVLALAVLIIGPLLGRGEALAETFGLGSAFTFTWNVLRLPLLVAGVVAWTATLFHYAPSKRTRWRYAVPGAVLTTALWVLASAGFHVYLRFAAGTNPVLGAFGGGVIVMLWVYLLSLALLLGGELNASLHDRRRPA